MVYRESQNENSQVPLAKKTAEGKSLSALVNGQDVLEEGNVLS